MQIKSFKLITGEEIIAEIVGTPQMLAEIRNAASVNSVFVKRPHVLQFQPVAPGQLGLALVPWTLSNPGISCIEIPRSAILAEFETQSEVERQYIEQTSGITLAV